MFTPAIRAMQLPYVLKTKIITLKADFTQSALALLMAWLGANNPYHTLTNNNFAIATNLFNRCLNSHFLLLIPEVAKLNWIIKTNLCRAPCSLFGAKNDARFA